MIQTNRTPLQQAFDGLAGSCIEIARAPVAAQRYFDPDDPDDIAGAKTLMLRAARAFGELVRDIERECGLTVDEHVDDVSGAVYNGIAATLGEKVLKLRLEREAGGLFPSPERLASLHGEHSTLNHSQQGL